MTWDPEPQPDPPSPPPSTERFLRFGDAALEIQGNILAGFLKDHQAFLFLRFPEQPSARTWLGELRPRVATTEQVAAFNEQFSAARRSTHGDDPTNLAAVWLNISLTGAGLEHLAPAVGQPLRDRFPTLMNGAASSAEALGDVDDDSPDRWVIGRPDQELHALLIVAADRRADLRSALQRQRTLAARHGVTIVFEQLGDALPGARAGHEHFGFKDGISQPGVWNFHEPDRDNPTQRKGHLGTDLIAAGEFVFGYARQGGEPGQFDTERPHEPWMANGSLQVFRRLRQAVPSFWAQVIERYESLRGDPMSPDLLAAKLVGRWRSGTPLDHAPEADIRSSRDADDDNNFTYDDDRSGHKTPRFAHVRKMYPRLADFPDRHRRRILRRGIPFGAPFDPAAGRARGVDAARGLLFNAYMTSIEEQFEFLQQQWANNPDFFARRDGPDPVIGDAQPPRVTLRREGLRDRRLEFRRFVQTTGAVYAFSPSISTLRRLADGEL